MPEKLVNDKVVMTEREEGPENKSVLKTPSGEANVQIVTLTWWQQAAIRSGRVYLQSLVGFMTAVGTGAAAGVGVTLDAEGFVNLLITSASIAVAPAAISFMQNMIEILTRLDATSPQVRA